MVARDLPFPPLPAGARAGEGRGAGGEGSGRAATGAEGALAAPRPLSQPQSAVFRANLLLEEAAVPLPSPAQIGLWSKTLGGIEPLLDLLRRLIHAGLSNKREPIAYIHRVVIERAARPEPAVPTAPAWQTQPRRGINPLLLAGLDDRRRELGRLIAAKRGV